MNYPAMLAEETSAFRDLKDRILEYVASPRVPQQVAAGPTTEGYRMGALSCFQTILPMLYDYHSSVRDIIAHGAQ